MKKLKTQETVQEVIDRAVRATGHMVPPTIFVPLDLRRSRRRLVKERVVVAPATEAEIQERIAAAAPHEFLIAVMNGQPIPAFEITEKQGHLDIAVTYALPSTQDRLNAAIALNSRKAPAPRDTAHDAYQEAIKNAAEEEEENGLRETD